MREVVLRTSFGTMKFQYEDQSSLDASLREIASEINTIAEATKQFLPRESRMPKPGLELAYRFTPSGKVELLYLPQTSVACVAFCLYAYHPETVSITELEAVTCISEVVAKVLSQTKNKQYFRKENEAYGLSSDGLTYVVAKILPTVPKPAIQEEDQGE